MTGQRDPHDHIEIQSWQWTSGRNWTEGDRRPGIPWIGLFLVIFGALLLVEAYLPDYRDLGNVALLAAGIASLLAWLIRRGRIALYAGAFLTALALPGTIEALGTPLGPGWGMFFFGLAALFVAVVRWFTGGGYGWQLWLGAILAGVGLFQIARPDTAGIILPAILVVVGVILLVGGRRP